MPPSDHSTLPDQATSSRARPIQAKSLWHIFTVAVTQWNEDRPFELAAALAYYTFFALSPLLIITIAIAGLVFERETAQDQLISTLQDLVGRPVAQAIQAMIHSASTPESGTLATVVGVVALLIGAVGIVGQLHDALNTIWGVTPRPGRSILGVLKDHFVSFAMVLGLVFLLLVSLVVSTALSAAIQFMRGLLSESILVLWQAVDILVSISFISVLFALIYKLLPDAKIAWRDVWIGAVVTAVLFTIGKSLIGLYLGRSGVASVYGGAGSLVVLLLWVYYSALIFLLGAEFTQVYARTYGKGVEPAEGATVVPDLRSLLAPQEKHG